MRNTAICLVLLLAACIETHPETPQRRIIIFQDITTSLAVDQSDAVQGTVNAIIDKALGGTDLIVIPICENTENAPSKRWIVPFPEGTSELAQRQARAKRAAIKTEISRFVQELRESRAVRTEYASCISPGLRVARTVVQNSSGKWNTDVVFVSDMIEECRMSLLGQPVRLLAGPQFADANKLLRSQQSLMNVSDVRVFVILPKAMSTAVIRPDHPQPQELEVFWEQMFARSGITSNRLWWDATVSQYIDSIQG